MHWLDLIEQLHAPLSVLMLAIFCAIVAWAYAPRQRAAMDDSAQIPLRDDR
jgi:cbb3-type cytochrome oxidase subunit 3